MDDSNALHLLYILFLLYQLHLILSGIRFRRLETPVVKETVYILRLTMMTSLIALW